VECGMKKNVIFDSGSIIDCEPLRVIKVYEGTYFGHVMSKAYQYVINDNKVFKGSM
jgi:hypothetical protein